MADHVDDVPVSADDVLPAPATWSAREPEHAWCPAPMQALVDVSVHTRGQAEPLVHQGRAGGWCTLGASVRGRSHAHRGEFRDDALAVHTSERLLVLAVADGAGSSALSRVGAAVCADVAVTRTAARVREHGTSALSASQVGTAMAHAVHDAALQLHALATAGEVSPAALRTTLILAAVHGDMMLVAQIGDGAVLVQKRDGSVLRVGGQREPGWAGEVTCFVPDPCAMTQAAALRQVDASEVELIALMTDGIDDPFHPLEQSGAALMTQWRHGSDAPIGTARQPYCGPVLAGPEAMLEWLTFEQRGEVDDRTLLLAWRAGATG